MHLGTNGKDAEWGEASANSVHAVLDLIVWVSQAKHNSCVACMVNLRLVLVLKHSVSCYVSVHV